MSYSFTVKAFGKAAAKDAVAAKFDEVVASQPIHAKDRDAVLANASAVIDLLMDAPDKDISVSVNGYLSWMVGDDQPIHTASVSAGASLVAKS